MIEQRYRAVLEVAAGSSVVEVAGRYGVSREAVHRWLRRFREEGLAGLADRSHRPRSQPAKIDARLEVLICELRRVHPGWGPRRLVHELERRGAPRVSRSTVYRVLVRNGLVEPVERRRRRARFKRWERPSPMQLWQMDVTGKVFLVDGAELKVVTGVDDHARFCVCAKVVRRATSRAVCDAFVEAMERYGVPEEVLTDNGKVFTGRFGKPRPPVEVLFDRICRENGIAHRLTRPSSPTTTGKIERLHQTLQAELLTAHGPFRTLEEAQEAIGAWREEYNQSRPHQSLGMATPASRFAPPATGQLPLRRPGDLRPVPTPEPPPAQDDHNLAPAAPVSAPEVRTVVAGSWDGTGAFELDRIVPASGNLAVGNQQIWFGPLLAGRTTTLWVDQRSIHVMIDGRRIKTLPCRLTTSAFARLAADGRPAGPAPMSPAAVIANPAGVAIETDRTVNACGVVSVCSKAIPVGSPLAGQRVTLRFDGPILQVFAADQLVRTMASPVPVQHYHRIRQARVVQPGPLPPPAAPRVERRVSCRGAIMIAKQRIHVGLPHAGKTVTVTAEADTFTIYDGDTRLLVARRATTKEVKRFKARVN